MDRYNVTGMSCAACQSRVEKAVSKVPGVEECSVNLLTGTMMVNGSATEEQVIRAVEQAGYGAERTGKAQSRGSAGSMHSDTLTDKDTPILRRRLLASLGFLMVLMYLSMGHMMFSFPIPAFLEQNHLALGLTELLLSAVILVINQKFFVNGFRGLLHGAPNMDTLIAIGSGASFGYSTVMLYLMSEAVRIGDHERAMACMDEFYFESAAMILTLITLGKMLEARSKGKTTDALKSLMDLAPKMAVVQRNGREEKIPAEDLQVGDLFVVRPGESFPADGVVVSGTGAVDESAITGESIPVDRAEGDRVTSATKNLSGMLVCRATRVGEDTTLSEIISLVSDSAAGKAPVAKLADQISGIFVPVVMAIAAVTTVIWLLCGAEVGFALARGICVLVVSCPCALGLATPVAIMVGNGVGAKNGILFKTAEALQETGRVKVVALDKTGTITLGKPEVKEVIPAGKTKEELLTLAGALEYGSEHPLGKAVREEAEHLLGAEIFTGYEIREFQVFPGGGLSGIFNSNEAQHELLGGNEAFLKGRGIEIPEGLKQKAEALAGLGQTPLFFAEDGAVMGLITVADSVKEDSKAAIERFHELGLKVVMLTGDNERTAKAVADAVGVDRVISGVKPDEKAAAVQSLKAEGKVAMVGDGINDAPALTVADMGIAIGAGTDVAIDAADVVLMKNSLMDAASAVLLSKRAYRIILENLFWALFYNVLLIPVAAGAYSKLFGITMHPMLGAAAMSLSSFCVVTNALRLNLVKLYQRKPATEVRKETPASKTASDNSEMKTSETDPDNNEMKHSSETDPNMDEHDKKISAEADQDKEKHNMTKTMKITGMMCMHCEARVKKALEAVAGVGSAEVSHEKGTAVVTLKEAVADDVLKKAVEDQDYNVTGIE